MSGTSTGTRWSRDPAMRRLKMQKLELTLIVALILVGGAAWFFGWVVPHDRYLRAVEVCMDGDPQAYQRCAEEEKTRSAVRSPGERRPGG